MARVHETDDGFFYEVDDIDIPLNEETYSAFQHRQAGSRLLDWIGVLDPRDEEHYSHFRYDQPEQEFNQMMLLAQRIGTVVVRDTPFDYIQEMFDKRYGLSDEELDGIFD